MRFALIGTGTVARVHALALESVPDACLVAVHNRTQSTGEKFALDNNCDYEPTLERLLARSDIDAVAIATASGTHAEIAMQAARAGKHVLCEKPLDITPEKIDSLIAVCHDAGVQLGAFFPSRFGAGAQAAKRAVEQGRLGQLSYCCAQVAWFRTAEYYEASDWRGTYKLDGGGALMNQSIHAIDLLLWLAGDVVEVSARCQTRAHAIETEDNGVAWVRFAHGGLGTIQGSTVCYPGEAKRVELKGTKGSITLSDDNPILWQFDEERPEDEEIRSLGQYKTSAAGAADPRAISSEGHRAQYQDFVMAVREGRAPSVSGAEGRRSVALIQAIYQSSRNGEIIKL